MKAIVVYECEVSGGTDRLLVHLIKNWPQKKTDWLVMCHIKNSGTRFISDELGSRASVITYSAGTWFETRGRGLKRFGVIGRISNQLFLVMASLSQFFYFRGVFKKKRPHIVYLHQGGYPGGFSGHMAGLAAKTVFSKSRVVASIQNLPAMREKRLFSYLLDRAVNAYADAYIFATRHTLNEYRTKTALCADRMNVIGEGVEANTSGKRLHNRSGQVNIGIIGAYEKRKGHSVLFDALKILKDRGLSGFRLHSFGQSQYGEFEAISRYASAIGIEGLITWHGYERDFDRLYGPLDIVVQASIGAESMPLVPIDAAAYFKPVVASRLPGLMETVEHDVTGYLFDIGNSLMLADYLEGLIGSLETRLSMGIAARKRYEGLFSAKVMAERYSRVFYGQRVIQPERVF
ncbi:MAG: glycosyltransferase [Deltaproteobacteria bacterium]|nr:glycosyltransferase [Deltaproteobacteria bacterium]